MSVVLEGISRRLRTEARTESLTSFVANSIAIAVLVLLFIAVTLRIAPNFLYPYPLEAGDGGMLSSAWRVATGSPIYNPVQHAPFVFNIHSPIFIHLSAFILKLFGPYAGGPRLLAELMLIGASFFVFLTTRRLTGSITASIVAALVLPLERHVVRRSGLAICDFCSLLFLMAGVYFWVVGGKWRWAAVASFVLAFFSKQSAVLVPQAVMLTALVERKRLRILLYEGAYLLLMGAGFGVCWLIWGKAFFLDTMYYGTVTRFDPWVGFLSILLTVATYPLFFIAAGWAVMRAFRRKTLIPAALLPAGLIQAYLVGNAGASHAYFFDLSAALALSMGLFWPYLVAVMERTQARTRRIALVFVVVQAVLIFSAALYKSEGRGVFLESQIKGEAQHVSMYERPGMVLSTRTGYDLGRVGMDFTTDPHRLGQLLIAGLVPREEIERLVRERQFSAVIMPADEDPLGIFDANLRRLVEGNYRQLGQTRKEIYFLR